MVRLRVVFGICAASLFGFWVTTIRGEDTAAEPKREDAPPAAATAPAATPPAATPPKPKFPPFAELFKEVQTKDGLIKLHMKGTKLYAELSANQLNKDFIVVISIARGIGRGHMLIGGMSLSDGDDWVWQFRKVDDHIQIVRRNVRFTADKGSPEEKAVGIAYTDSVLYSLPVVTTGPSGGWIVDLTPVFMSDLPQISQLLPGFSFSQDRSCFAEWKPMQDNVELEIAATYGSSGTQEFDTVADSRGATVNVHYSISQLKTTAYQSRMADDRVGYFLTVMKDFSKKGDQDRFVRYINRWDLRKADSSADMSPPTKPITFYLEKTIPYTYRKPIREGILEWNRAFEKAGFVNAVEVQLQPDNAEWDPEDINYNTFRWITAGAGFAIGPSRTNPMTGQILDADILLDADFVQYWKDFYETFTPASLTSLIGGPFEVNEYLALAPRGQRQHEMHDKTCGCQLFHGVAREMALGATVLMARTASPAEREKLIMQGLKEVTMHEVGHTLGLRHNFKASAMLTLEEMNDVTKTKDTGLTASVMDYSPVNIMPKDKMQGDFYSTTIGPYDMWAIEYGYKTLSGGTAGEVAELKKIASRSAESQLAYATDEDSRGIDPDPLVNQFDLGKDTLAYAKVRAQIAAEMWPSVVELVTKDGDGYQKARKAFEVILDSYGKAMYMAARNIGGVYINRSHKGDPNAPAPYTPVEVAKQREALKLMEELVFSDVPFQFPPDLYNHLAGTHWLHWGIQNPVRGDYPVHQAIENWQDLILRKLLASLTLERMSDTELKVPADQDALTTPELFERLTKAIYAELDKPINGEFTNRKPAISSLRRSLQRNYLKRMSSLALGETSAPQDAQTAAYAELLSLHGKLESVLNASGGKLDAYTKAHLAETRDRIKKVLEARLESKQTISLQQLLMSPHGE